MNSEDEMSSARANDSVGAIPAWAIHVRVELCDPCGSLPTPNIL